MRFSGSNLRRLREEKGLSRTTLAYRLGVSEGSVLGYEYGRMHPSVPRLALIATELDCQIGDLFDTELAG